jgi:hypothetical protein
MKYRRKPEEVTVERWDGTDPEFHPELQRFSTRTDARMALVIPTVDDRQFVLPGEYLCTRRDGTAFKLTPFQLAAEYEPIAE